MTKVGRKNTFPCSGGEKFMRRTRAAIAYDVRHVAGDVGGSWGSVRDGAASGRLARLAATTRWLTFASLTGLACSGSDTASRTTEQAAASALATRLTGPTDDTVRTLLSKTLHPLARVARDVGRADGDRVWHGLSVVFNVTPAAQADLDALLVAQQSRTSPDYHRWLTPEAYADRFGMSPSDVDAVEPGSRHTG